MAAATTIITGGGSGIGRQIARRILEHDAEARCAIVDLRCDGALALVDEFGPGRVMTVDSDVGDPAAAAEAVTSIAAWQGSIGALVNSAGIQINASSLDFTFADWRRVMSVHLDGTFLYCQQAARHMIAAGGGAILNMASVSMFFGQPRRLPYASAKAAIGSLTRTLAVEWAGYGIRVNALAPGYIETPFMHEAIARGHYDPEEARTLHAMQRFGTTDEVADAALFLLSEQASFITGEILRVDGGFAVKKMPGS